MTENSILLERAGKGEKKAQEELVLNNMGLVRSIASRFSFCGYDIEDLSQIGAIGLIKAVRKFDVSYGVKFSTYAVPVIMGEIKRFLRDDGIIKISRSIRENAIKAKKCENELRNRLGREPTLAEISEKSEISVDDLLEAYDATNPVETITPINDEGQEYNLPVCKNDSNEEKIINRIFVENMLDSLSEREKKIIILRYFRNKTQAEVAKEIGVSQVQISRIEKNTMQSLKDKFDTVTV